MPMERKKRSEEFLRENNIPVDESLPPIVSENEADIKSAEAIMKRAVTSFLASMAAFMLKEGENVKKTVSFFGWYLRVLELENELTADEERIFGLEKKLIPRKPDDGFLDDMIQRFERCLPLFWSCGLIDGDLDYPSGISQADVMALSKVIRECGHFGHIMAAVNMHTLPEILDNADEAYRMYSACRTAAAEGREPPANLSPSVLAEQHRGFNWITGEYDRDGWDGVAEGPWPDRGNI